MNKYDYGIYKKINNHFNIKMGHLQCGHFFIYLFALCFKQKPINFTSHVRLKLLFHYSHE